MSEKISTVGNKLPSPSAKTDKRAGKYLLFALGQEEFGIRVLNVREIKGMQEITAVPHTPPYLKGVINLRGKVIPVIDLRVKFGLPSAEETGRRCIIIIEMHAVSSRKDAHRAPMGIVVDSVSEVVTLQPDDIEDAPDFGSGTDRPYLLGMAKVKNRVKILLDIDEALASDAQLPTPLVS